MATNAQAAVKSEAPGYDEMYDAGGATRGHYEALAQWLVDCRRSG